MGSDCAVAAIGDYCLKIGSGATPRGGSSVYKDRGEIFLIRSQNIYNDGFKPQGLVFIDEEAASKLKNVIIEENDILLNITGDSVARVCLARAEYLPARVNQHVAIIRPDPKEFDARYLRYVLSSPYMQKVLLNLASAGATRNALTKSMIETLIVSKPPLFIQTSIADNLEALDDKILLNNQTNQTLERMAQTLFKSWFVDFDPVFDNALLKAGISTQEHGNEAQALLHSNENEENLLAGFPEALRPKAKQRLSALRRRIPTQERGNEGQCTQKLGNEAFPSEFEFNEQLGWIPKGWEVSKLSELITIKHGFAYKGEFFSDTETENILLTPGNVSVGGGFKNAKYKYYNGPINDEYIFKEGDMYVTMTDLSKASDTLGYPAIVPKIEGITFHHNQRLGKVIYNEHKSSKKEFLYQTLCSYESRNNVLGSATGTTVKHTSPTKILSLFICHSGGGIESIFETQAKTFYEKVATNNLSNIALTKLRDTLLPKLISGELQLPDLEQSPRSHAPRGNADG